MPTRSPQLLKEREKKTKVPDPGNMMLFLYTAAILIFLLWGGIVRAETAEVAAETGFSPEDIRQGELFLPKAGGYSS